MKLTTEQKIAQFEKAEIVKVQHTKERDEYYADVEVIREDDGWWGIYFDNDCIIDESNIDKVVFSNNYGCIFFMEDGTFKIEGVLFTPISQAE